MFKRYVNNAAVLLSWGTWCVFQGNLKAYSPIPPAERGVMHLTALVRSLKQHTELQKYSISYEVNNAHQKNGKTIAKGTQMYVCL